MTKNVATRWAVSMILTSAMALGGCAAGTDSNEDDGTKDTQATAQLKFAKCMRANGVDVPDPEPDSGMIKLGPGDETGSVTRDTLEKAQKACAKYLKQMGGPAGGETSQADKTRMLKFAACMRKQGVDMPDPDFSNDKGGVTFELPQNGGAKGDVAGGPGDPAFQTAHEACKKYFGPES